MTDSSNNKPARSILYLAYDGLTDDIGQSQILPYLTGCADRGHRITVISFEKPERYARLGEMVGDRCSKAGIDWRSLRFRSRPPLLAKLLDLRELKRNAVRLAIATPFDVVHARGYPAAAAALAVKKQSGVTMIFDTRGFWPDQRREGGRWPAESLHGELIYRRWKANERAYYRNADHIVALTNAANKVISVDPGYGGAPISVIPCCADFELFRVASDADRVKAKQMLRLQPTQPVLGYLGSFGGVYRLDLHCRLLAAIQRRDPSVITLIVGHTPKEEIETTAEKLGLTLSNNSVLTVPARRSDVPALLAAIDVGTCFCIWSGSSLGVSPTKAAEYLASGIPVISNEGIGDTPEMLRRMQSGMSIVDESQDAIEQAADAFFALGGRRGADIRVHAKPVLDLDHAIDAYDQIYRDPGLPVRLTGAS